MQYSMWQGIEMVEMELMLYYWCIKTNSTSYPVNDLDPPKVIQPLQESIRSFSSCFKKIVHTLDLPLVSERLK